MNGRSRLVERKMKKWSRNNRTLVGRLKERVVVSVVVKSEYKQAKSLSCSKCERSKILILLYI